MDQRQAPGYVFIAGGVGVTPLYSMLLTMRQAWATRLVLIIGGLLLLASLLLALAKA